VLRFPRGHPMTRWMADICENPARVLVYDGAGCRLRKRLSRILPAGRLRAAVRWGHGGGPHGFTAALVHFGLLHLAQPSEVFYPVPYEQWRCLFEPSPAASACLGPDTHAVHLWNAALGRAVGFDKDDRFPPESLIGVLKGRYLP